MKFSLTLCFLAFVLFTNAQDFSFGKTAIADFNHTEINDDALVIKEFGRSTIEFNTLKNQLVLRKYYHTKILLLTKDGLEYANFSIPLHKSSNSDKELIVGLKGITYNVENGKIVKTDLDKKNTLTEKSSEYLDITKIAFPNAKEGSIIELRYTIESPYLFNLESWNFQEFIPKLSSEYVTEIPDICIYNVNMKGGGILTSRKTENFDTKMATSTGEIYGVRTIYTMENIPAFVAEEYMTAPKNFMSTLTFELASYSIPFGPSKNFTTTWTDVDKILMSSDDFGRELKRKNLFKEIIPTLIADKNNDYDKADAIFTYIKKNIKSNKKTGIYTDNGVKKALELKNGNVADINIALICALQEAGLNANPVILSTRDNGYPSFTHPAISDFNYTIAHVIIDDAPYFLDASEEYAPFGLLPFQCINFKGRLFQGENSNWTDLIANQASRVNYMFEGELTDNGKLNGQLLISRSGHTAINKRKEIKSFNSLEEYFEDYDSRNLGFTIKSQEVINLGDPKNLITEKFEIELENFANTANNKLAFNPLFVGRSTKNPFNSDSRTYPVDMGSKIEESFDIKIKIPDSFQLTSQPKNINMALPNKDARYLFITKNEDNVLNIQLLSAVNKPFFAPEEYYNLKEFFSQIIQMQKIDYVLEKM